MNYTSINLDAWERGELFKYYIETNPMVMSLTVDVDVTELDEYRRKNGLKFYPLMLWVVSSVINSRDEFKYSLTDGGELIRWDFVSPSYVDFHPEDERFTRLVTEFTPNPCEFYKRFYADKEKNKDVRGFTPDRPPNFFDVSCLPWVKYKHFDAHVFDEGKRLAPVVVWGKYEPSADGRLILPLTMKVHHAVADGFHLSRFFLDVENTVGELAKKEWCEL